MLCRVTINMMWSNDPNQLPLSNHLNRANIFKKIMRAIYFVQAGILLLFLSIRVNPAPHKGIRKQLKFLAAADGKSFFADDREYMTWYEAVEYCKPFGMKLASITSQAQFDAIAASPDFPGDVYTSGREARELRQYSWNDTNEAPPPEFPYRTLFADFQLCLVYTTNFEGPYFVGRGCREAVAKPMCESG